MKLWQNPAVWIAFTAVSFFWLSDWILGTDLNRDVVDLAGVFFGAYMAIRLFPDTWDRFLRGGVQKNWQLLISNELFWIGWIGFCTWTLVYRGSGRPDWMAYSPMNGFFKFIILGGGIMSFFATTETPTPMPATRLFYISIGVAAGGLIGFAIARLMQ